MNALVAALIVIIILLAVIAYGFLRNGRSTPGSNDKTGKQEGREMYSYDSMVMDEVLGAKIIEGLKDSLRTTEGEYKKLTERFADNREKRIELANDWLNYLEILDNIKQSRIDYRLGGASGEHLPGVGDSERVKLAIENKFKDLLEAS